MEALLIGVGGALVGVIGTELVRMRRDKRIADERLRGAARMVSVELGMAALLSENMANRKSVWLLGNLPTAAWRAHGADLAQALSDDAFATVAEAATKVEAARSISSGAPVSFAQSDADDSDALKPLIDMCRRAQDVLAPLAYPDPSS